MDVDTDDTGTVLGLAASLLPLVAVVRPWFTVTRSPVDPTTPGYETMYGLVAAVVALVVLVALVTDHLDRTRWSWVSAAW
jgi:hypothetical protein